MCGAELSSVVCGPLMVPDTKAWAARGLGRLGLQVTMELASFGLGAHAAGLGGGGLAALATLPMMSPRLMGGGAYYTVYWPCSATDWTSGVACLSAWPLAVCHRR